MGTTQAEAILLLAKSRPYFNLSDAKKVGTPRVVLTRLVREGQLERVSRGLYRHPQSPISQNSDLLKVAHHSGQGVFCLLTALRFHGITPHLLSGVWLGIPHQSKPPRLSCAGLNITRFSRAIYLEGIETHEINGFPIRVYSVARTLADCFKFREKIGMHIVLKALHYAWVWQHVAMHDLLHYARICKVEHVMQPYLESLVWCKQNHGVQA